MGKPKTLTKPFETQQHSQISQTNLFFLRNHRKIEPKQIKIQGDQNALHPHRFYPLI